VIGKASEMELSGMNEMSQQHLTFLAMKQTTIMTSIIAQDPSDQVKVN
jgi:hypothetical protein